MRPVLLAALLLGCSSPVRTVAIDYAATDDQRAALNESVSAWNLRLLPDRRLRHASSPDVDAFVLIGDPRNGTHGVWRESEGRITIRGDINGDLFRRTLRHELGHAIGLEHTSCGVMQFREDSFPELTFCDDDIRECRDQGACP